MERCPSSVKPVCFALLLAIDSRINDLNGFDWKTANSNREGQMQISRAKTINYESIVCACIMRGLCSLRLSHRGIK